jgi:hypothetical protein
MISLWNTSEMEILKCDMALDLFQLHTMLRPKIKIAVVPVTRPTLCFAPKKPDSNYFIGIFVCFFVEVVFMLPTSFL